MKFIPPGRPHGAKSAWRRKTQGGQNATLREKAIASFRGLQASSVPFRPSGCVSRSGSLGSTRLQRSAMQLPSCEKGSEPSRACAWR
ncbi:Acyltransferase BOA11 [Fusarium oxysporum f. sp. albedinis]|nr:Acyltransferase BOA11 [Fusarium oxysporum f. sp. albedinis]